MVMDVEGRVDKDVVFVVDWVNSKGVNRLRLMVVEWSRKRLW